MMAFISTKTFDLDGFVGLDLSPESNFGDITRRTNVVKTLDGGVAINDGGSSHGDRSAVLIWKTKSKAFEENIMRIVESYSRVNISSSDGFFDASPSSYTQSGAESVLNLSLLSKL